MIIIILCVPRERMVMASGATNPRPQKRLRYSIANLRFLSTLLFTYQRDVIPKLRCVHHITGSGNDLSCQFVPGSIGRHFSAQPGLKRANAFCSPDIMVPFLAILE